MEPVICVIDVITVVLTIIAIVIANQLVNDRPSKSNKYLRTGNQQLRNFF